MKIVLAADGAGEPVLDVIAVHLAGKPDLEVTDLSQSGYYADIADRAASAVARGEYDRGALFWGAGIGMCISANKVPGIRAALTHDTNSAERAANSNNAQIITKGAGVIGPELAKAIVDTWLASAFDAEGPSARNIEAIDKLGEKYAKPV